jgi:uncharacterized membrane protein (DUF441 family)
MVRMASPARRLLVGIAVLASAVVVAACGTLAATALSPAVLVAWIGQDGITAMDDTPRMFALVAGCYAFGALAGVATFAIGHRRWLREEVASRPSLVPGAGPVT